MEFPYRGIALITFNAFKNALVQRAFVLFLIDDFLAAGFFAAGFLALIAVFGFLTAAVALVMFSLAWACKSCGKFRKAI